MTGLVNAARAGRFAAVVSLAVAMLACQERLTAPGECPELCPGGSPAVFDTVLNPVPLSDSSIAGYVGRGSGIALLVSNGLPAANARAVYRFTARGDSVPLRDTLRAYTIDSVAIGLTISARDTLLDGLKLFLFQLPQELPVDSNLTFAQVEPLLTTENLIDSILVADTLNAGQVRTTLRGTDLDKVAIPPGTGGVLSLAVGVGAPVATGVRLGSVAGTNSATFTTYVTLDVPDTGAVRRQSLTPSVAFNTFVRETTIEPDTTLITLGGEPSSRALLRFDLPPKLEDSATIVRATLELIPVEPIVGLERAPAVLQARAVLADLGAKSPVSSDERILVSDTVSSGSADTVRLDVTPIVQFWQAAAERPEALSLTLQPEAATFTRAVFGSTRQPASSPPRLRITYLVSFPFENP
ncbi:MAG: hypothetical protein H0T90_02410 [Gemmatimonadales bacterium]|nr:hypothetical protein [Gemmatimonadales bacterium]